MFSCHNKGPHNSFIDAKVKPSQEIAKDINNGVRKGKKAYKRQMRKSKRTIRRNKNKSLRSL